MNGSNLMSEHQRPGWLAKHRLFVQALFNNLPEKKAGSANGSAFSYSSLRKLYRERYNIKEGVIYMLPESQKENGIQVMKKGI
jgi:hypothetical protein